MFFDCEKKWPIAKKTYRNELESVDDTTHLCWKQCASKNSGINTDKQIFCGCCRNMLRFLFFWSVTKLVQKQSTIIFVFLSSECFHRQISEKLSANKPNKLSWLIGSHLGYQTVRYPGQLVSS